MDPENKKAAICCLWPMEKQRVDQKINIYRNPYQGNILTLTAGLIARAFVIEPALDMHSINYLSNTSWPDLTPESQAALAGWPR